MNTALRRTLEQLTRQLIDPQTDVAGLKRCADAMYDLFASLAGLDEDAEDQREHRNLATGKAIGTVWAGMCLREFRRTQRFLQGIHAAMQVLRSRFPDGPLRVAYAGTGPFATLALPLTTLWSPEDVQFTFMDINETSLACLEHVLAALDARPWVEDVICCDATTYRFAPVRKPHLLISETMLRALKNEPQVAIMLNLVPQLVPGGLAVPQAIQVDAGLMHHRRYLASLFGHSERRDFIWRIGTAFRVDAHRLPTLETGSTAHGTFPEVAFEIPADRDPGFDTLQLFTTIQVFDTVWLHDWDCSLNLPERVVDILEPTQNSVSFQYHIAEKPGLRWLVAAGS